MIRRFRIVRLLRGWLAISRVLPRYLRLIERQRFGLPVSEADCRDYTSSMKLPVIGCCCPACGDLSLQRQRIKQLLMDLERDNVGVKNSMLKALSNVSPRHLLDTRLNPPAEIVEDQDTPQLLQIRIGT